jgi:hypothetical protein
VTFSDIGQHPYTATANSDTDYGQALWAGLQAGSYLDWEGAIAPYVAPVLTPGQQAAAAIAAGIVLTSASKAALNGTYPVDPATQVKLNSAVTYIMLNNAFPPASAASLAWYDMSGVAHSFTSVPDFKNFAVAFADFVAHVDIFASSNGSNGSIPSNTLTIP